MPAGVRCSTCTRWSSGSRRFRVVLFDYVGSGSSDVSAWSEERYGSLDGYAQDVIDICEELDLRDVTFV
ncbi:hypothetical protein ABZS63_36420, partial [Streptomyces sp. NPDC005568]